MKQKVLFILTMGIMIASTMQGQTLTKRGLVYELYSDGTACLVGTNAKIIGERTIDAEIRSSNKTYRVNSVRARALAGQSYLTKLIINAELDTIGIGAFRDCTMMSAVEPNGSVKILGSYAFANTGLKSIDISSWNPQSMGTGILAECRELTEAHLPAGITVLPECTFSGCTSLIEPNLESLPLTKIEAHALCNCSAITNLKLPDSIVTIGDDVFSGMTALTEPNLPQGVTHIGHFAFKNCTSLENIELPEALTGTGISPFYGCTSLREVTLPAKITGVENMYMFDNCPALEKILVNSANTKYTSTDGVLYLRTGNKLVAYPAGLSHSVHPTLPNVTEPLAPGALSHCELDAEMTLPRLTTTIAREAFANTTGMKSLRTESNPSLKTIDDFAFHNSKELNYVNMSSRVTSVGRSAFQCIPLENIYLRSTTAPTMDASGFSETTYANAVLHVPSNRTSAYKSTDGWGRFVSIEDDGLTAIQEVQADELSDDYYNLQGMRVTKPHKGIYIVNGQKTILSK